jgi:hypothetical protein
MESTSPNGLTEVVSPRTIEEWLPRIFPEGTPARNYVTRQISAKTVFVMLYIGAVEGTNRWMRPDQVTKMTDAQAGKLAEPERLRWSLDSIAKKSSLDLSLRWYQPNTREPIRDETLRSGLIRLGAVVQRTDVPTTSSLPRYALARDFYELLLVLRENPGKAEDEISAWQARHLDRSALSRVELLRRGTVRSGTDSRVTIRYPNGETRLVAPGPSSVISKAVIEEFIPRFLREPGVLLVSDSSEKIVSRDEQLARDLGLNLDAARTLPDIILVDLHANKTRLIFIEVVATDGAVTEARKEALTQFASAAGYSAEYLLFVTAFLDRTASSFRRLASEIAWDSYAWFTAEPEHLLHFQKGPKLTLLSTLI